MTETESAAAAEARRAAQTEEVAALMRHFVDLGAELKRPGTTLERQRWVVREMRAVKDELDAFLTTAHAEADR